MRSRFVSDERAEVGGPEPAGLNDRQKALVKLFVALTVVAVLSVRVGLLWELAYDAGGVGRSLISHLTAGFEIDFAVLVPFGMVTAWVVLFWIDRTKRLQRSLLVLAYFLILAWVVFVQERWTEEIRWIKYWYGPILGFLAGLVIGVGPQLWGGREGREFPSATVGLFVTASVLSVVALLDVYLFAADTMLERQALLLPPPGSSLGLVVDVLVVFGFVSLFGWFLIYTDRRSVAILGTDHSLIIAVMAGLLDHVQGSYDGRSLEGGTTLGEAYYPLGRGNRPNPPEHSAQRFNLRYLSPASQRWLYVSAVPIEAVAPGEEVVQRIIDAAGGTSRLNRLFVSVIGNFLPAQLERTLSLDTKLFVDTVADADALVFVLSIKDFNGYEPGIDWTPASLSPPDELDTFTHLCDRIDDRRDRIVVVTDADQVLHLNDAGAVTDEDFVRVQLLDIDERYTVVPVTWGDDAEDSQLVAGIEDLRRALED